MFFIHVFSSKNYLKLFINKNLRIKGKENGGYKLETASFLSPNLNLIKKFQK